MMRHAKRETCKILNITPERKVEISPKDNNHDKELCKI